MPAAFPLSLSLLIHFFQIKTFHWILYFYAIGVIAVLMGPVVETSILATDNKKSSNSY